MPEEELNRRFRDLAQIKRAGLRFRRYPSSDPTLRSYGLCGDNGYARVSSCAPVGALRSVNAVAQKARSHLCGLARLRQWHVRGRAQAHVTLAICDW
jgi:hypothetical protein